MRLEVKELLAGYGRIEVLHGVSIEVDNQRVGLFGPNTATARRRCCARCRG